MEYMDAATVLDLRILAVLFIILVSLCITIACVWTSYRETLTAIYLNPSAFEMSGDQAAAAASAINFNNAGDPPLSSRLSQSSRGFGSNLAAPIDSLQHMPSDISSFSRHAKHEIDKASFDDQPARVHVASAYSVSLQPISVSSVYLSTSNSPIGTPARSTTQRRLSSSQQLPHVQPERALTTGTKIQATFATGTTVIGGSSGGSVLSIGPVSSVPLGNYKSGTKTANDRTPIALAAIPMPATLPGSQQQHALSSLHPHATDIASVPISEPLRTQLSGGNKHAILHTETEAASNSNMSGIPSPASAASGTRRRKHA